MFVLIVTLFSSVFAIPEKDADGYYLVKTDEEFEWCLNPELISLEQVHKIKLMADIDLSYGGTKRAWKKVSLLNVELLGQHRTITMSCDKPVGINAFGDPKFYLFKLVQGSTVDGISIYKTQSTYCPSLFELSSKAVISLLSSSERPLYCGRELSRVTTTVDTKWRRSDLKAFPPVETLTSGEKQLYDADGKEILDFAAKRKLFELKCMHGLTKAYMLHN